MTPNDNVSHSTFDWVDLQSTASHISLEREIQRFGRVNTKTIFVINLFRFRQVNLLDPSGRLKIIRIPTCTWTIPLVGPFPETPSSVLFAATIRLTATVF